MAEGCELFSVPIAFRNSSAGSPLNLKFQARRRMIQKCAGEEELIDSDRLAEVKQFAVSRILDSCARNEISPAIALLRLTSASHNSADLEDVVELAIEAAATQQNAALAEVCALYLENRLACERFMTMSSAQPASEPMTADARITHLRESFDTWVEEDDALSVAAYTFGNPRLMQQASQEVIDVLDQWGLLGAAVDALQIGCGTGRIEALLGPRVHLAWGIDIAAKMIDKAEEKIAHLQNVRFSQCSGRDLEPFEANSFDLVYAVDSFPYIVQAGADVVESYFAEVARVLRDRGHFVIFHYSYRGDLARDLNDVRRMAATYGYSIVREAARPFTIWDGAAYQLQLNPR